MKASVIIPTLNRCVSLKSTLQSIFENNTTHELFEVVIIDNGSTDNTRQVFDGFAGNYNNIRYFFEPINGLLSGRHKGAQEATGDILVFIDDDIRVCANWIENILQSFNDPLVHLVGGPYLPLYEKPPPAWLDWFWQPTPHGGKVLAELSLLDLGNSKLVIEPHYVFGLGYAIRKTTLIEAGGFHPDCIAPNLQQFQGDGETGLSFKIKEKGYKTIYNPEVLIYHEVPASRMTYEYFDKRYFYQGVCDAYTTIRARNSSIHVSKWTIIKLHLAEVKNNLQLALKLKSTETFLKKRFFLKNTWGQYFLHQHCASNSKLINWIIKEDYWNYDYRPYY